MALSGTVIPGEIYAWTAVFILPVNSALNPFLYTFSAIIRAVSYINKITKFFTKQSYNQENGNKPFNLKWRSNLSRFTVS